MSRLQSGRRWASTLFLLGATNLASDAQAQGAGLPAPALAASAALQRRDTKALAPLIAPLRDAVRDRTAASAPLLLVWGRAELAAGNPDSAQTAFVAVANGADTPALGLLEQARMLLVRQLAEGIDLWYLAAEAADPATWSELRRDLASIFSPTEAKAFDALAPGAPRGVWLRAFWALRDERDLRNPGERLLEHYRRLDYVRAKFPLPDKRRQYLPGAAYKSETDEVDDRGVIYLRQGPPTQVVRAGRDGPQNFQTVNADGGVPFNETWRYASPEGDRFYTFRACATPGPRSLRYVPGTCVEPLDYQLVESVLDVFGPSVTRRIASGRTTIRGRDSLLPSDVELTILARANLDDRFAAMLGADRFTLPMRADEERSAGAADVKVGTTTDAYAHRFAQPMGARIEALTAGREGAEGLVHVAYAIDVASVLPTRTADGFLYPVRVKAQMRDTRDSIIATFEERRAFRSKEPLGRRETLLGRVALPAPAGTQTLRVVLEHTRDIGTATGPVKITIPAVRPGTLTGGDLILGHSRIPLVWLRAPDDSVRFNPTGSFAPVQELELYQELYGLAAGQDYSFELTVSRERDGLMGKVIGGDATTLTLSGAEKAIGPVTPVRRFLDISKLEPGRYAVKVEYRADGGGKLMRSRSFQVK